MTTPGKTSLKNAIARSIFALEAFEKAFERYKTANDLNVGLSSLSEVDLERAYRICRSLKKRFKGNLWWEKILGPHFKQKFHGVILKQKRHTEEPPCK